MATFLGFPRSDGTVGTRNLVAIVGTMDTANPVARAIQRAVVGTVLIPGQFLRGQIGRDREITLSSLANLCMNPNIAATLVVGLEPVTTEELAARIRAVGRPVEAVSVQPLGGTINTVAEGTRQAARLVRAASKLKRVEVPLAKLTLGLQCGGSDTTSGLASNPSIGVVTDRLVAAGGTAIISETSEFFGAEHLFASRAASADVKARFMKETEGLEAAIMAEGVDLRGANPTRDNIRGGLTTIEEKALGAMAKAGKAPLQGVLGYGERPAKAGLHFMAAPAPAVENITALAAGGCQLCLFSTGVGNPIGHPVMTVIKLSGNRNTIDTFSDNVDFDVTSVIEKGERLDAVGGRLFDYMVAVASGELTTSEILDTRETAISRFGLSM